MRHHNGSFLATPKIVRDVTYHILYNYINVYIYIIYIYSTYYIYIFIVILIQYIYIYILFPPACTKIPDVSGHNLRLQVDQLWS